MKRSSFKPRTAAIGVLAVAAVQRKAAVKEKKPAAGPKLKACAVCREKFAPSGLVRWCSYECGAKLGRLLDAKKKAKAQRQERAETKAKLQELEPLEYWLKRAERAFNAFIRKRDEGQGCISCGRKNAEIYNAGHFVSVGANRTLRFHEDNVHLQCARPCNKDKGGNIHEYRKGLLVKIGPERLAALDGWWPPVKMTREGAQAIEATYKQKLKELEDKQ